MKFLGVQFSIVLVIVRADNQCTYKNSQKKGVNFRGNTVRLEIYKREKGCGGGGGVKSSNFPRNRGNIGNL